MTHIWKPTLWLTAAVIGALVAHTFASAQDETDRSSDTQTSALQRLAIQRAQLDNGLRVVLSPDHTVPTIAVAVYYDVGSRNEVQGRSGFAHLFEHMMFQGSDNVAKGQHFSLIMNRGGSLNGTTSSDRTNYYETLPSNELALGLWLEADRMRTLAVTEENFENQRQVVMEEWRQSYGNQPYAMSFLRINELAYGDYWPYAHSTIGDIQDLQNAPLEAVQEFWTQYYPPNNAVLSISGDFNPEEAMTLINQYFGSIAPRDVPAYTPPELTPQTEMRQETMTDPLASLAAFHLDWHIPPNRAEDHYALEMLSLILGRGESSRLHQELVKEEEVCVQVSASTDDRRGPDLFSIFGVVANGHQPEAVRQQIATQVQNVREQPVSTRELEKARNTLRSIFVFGLQSNLQRARQLAEFELYAGDATLIRSELDRYLAVTAEDIQRVAAQYLTNSNLTVLDVVPPTASEAGAS